MFVTQQIVNEFIDLAKAENQELNFLKLRALVYFAHGWYMGLTGEVLLDEDIIASKYGPTIYSIDHRYKEFGIAPIDGKMSSIIYIDDKLEIIEPKIEDQYIKDCIFEVWKKYKHLTDRQLMSLAHQSGSPWHIVRSYTLPFLLQETDINIPNEIIKKLFKEALDVKRREKMRTINLKDYLRPSDDIIKLFNIDQAKRYLAVPVEKMPDGTVVIAINDPTNTDTIDKIHALLFNYMIVFVIADLNDITERIDSYYANN